MKRKVVQQGAATLMVSLPAKWAKKFSLKKGDEVEIEEQEKRLVITTEKGLVPSKIRIGITGLSQAMVERYLLSAYKAGYEEIEVFFQNPEVINLKTGKRTKTASLIQQLVNNMMGLEIIDHKEKSCILRDFGKTTNKEFDSIINRVLTLVIAMSEDALKAEIESNKEELLNMQFRHDNINRFINFGLRILTKHGYTDFKKTPPYYEFLSEIERIIDVYAFLGVTRAGSNKKLSKEVINVYKEVNNSLKLFKSLFSNFKNEILLEIIKSRRKILDSINSARQNLKKEEIPMLDWLAVLTTIILDITETTMIIRL